MGQGLAFRCPHCELHIVVAFKNPLDGSSSAKRARVLYQRRGSTFGELSVEPRILFTGHARIRIIGGDVEWEELTE